MGKHYTAWVTTDRACLVGDVCDVTVLEDRQLGDDDDPRGWSSFGDPLFYAETAIAHADDDAGGRATEEAAQILARNGWTPAGAWEDVPSGYICTVTKAAT